MSDSEDFSMLSLAPARGEHGQTSSPPLRVLMVTPRFPPDLGGVERHVHEVARRLVTLGCEVTVLCTDRSRSMPSLQQVDGIGVMRVPAWPRRRDYYFAPGVWRKMATVECDVVHVQSYHTLVAPLAMARALHLRLPFVLTFHGGGHSSGFRRALRRLHQRAIGPLVRRATRLVAIARFEVPLYGRTFRVPPDRFVCIPNGTNPVAADPTIHPPDSAAPVIASIGRLERYKGHHRVLAAFPEVLRRRPEASMWIVGTGSYESELRRRAMALGVADRVQFRSTPSDQPELMVALMQASSVIVSLSEFESHPLVAVEAAAVGRPLVVSATSGLQELADDGWAQAIPLDSDPVTVATAILSQLDDPSVLPEITLTSWDECASQLLALYQETTA